MGGAAAVRWSAGAVWLPRLVQWPWSGPGVGQFLVVAWLCCPCVVDAVSCWLRVRFSGSPLRCRCQALVVAVAVVVIDGEVFLYDVYACVQVRSRVCAVAEVDVGQRQVDVVQEPLASCVCFVACVGLVLGCLHRLVWVVAFCPG